MANYGKILVPIGIVFLIPGIALASGSGGALGPVLIGVGILMLAIGLPRLVQGKERKIMGQIIRPKAAARSSAIWALFIFNATPFYLPGSRIMNYSPPQPLAIWIGGYWRQEALGYGWIPGVIISFFVLFVLGLILSGKFPKTFHVMFNLVILTCLYFWLNFGLQLFLWSFFEDKSTIEFFSMPPFDAGFGLQFGLGMGILIMSLIGILRMIKKTGEAYETFYVEGAQRVLVFVAIVVSYIGTAFPLYFSYQMITENNAYSTPYINYVGFIFVIYIGIKLFTTLVQTIRQFSREQQGSGIELDTTKFGFSTALYLVVFFLAWAPIVLPLIDNGMNSKHNSVYNSDWNGWSNYKDSLETAGYEVRSVQSSISAINSIDTQKQIVLVTAGPNVFYNPASEIPFFLTAFKSNFSMFICEDQGTAENLLFQMFIASAPTGNPTPLTFIPDGILMDNASYWKTPAFPVIESFSSSSPITQGVDNVVLSYASGFLGGEIISSLGWDIIGSSSGSYSYIDVNNDSKYDKTEDVYEFPSAITNILQDQDGAAGLTGDMLSLGFPLGGYSQAVFTSKQVTPSSRVFCATDASWLNNELTSIDEYDNLQMGMNVMSWLSCGRNPENTLIVFDEAHIRVEAGWRDISSAGSFGVLQGYVNWLSTNPILGLVYPLFALRTLTKWIPKEGDKQKVQLKDLEEAERNRAMLKFRTSSFFAQKINWYRKNNKYRLALKQLYRRLERKVNRILGASAQRDVDAIMDAIKAERGNTITKDQYKRIENFFETMLALKENKEDVDNEEDFEDIFMQMSWVNDVLSSR